MSIPAVKGFEIGAGFKSAELRKIILIKFYQKEKKTLFKSNNAEER